MNLTGDERHLVQLWPPLVRDFNAIIVFFIFSCFHTEVVRVLDDVLHVIVMNSIEYIPKVRALRHSTINSDIRDELHELRIVLEFWQELLHWQLVVVRHTHPFYFTEREHWLLLREYHLDEVFVDHFIWRDIELEKLREVLHEVSFRSELAHELLRHYSPLLRSLSNYSMHVDIAFPLSTHDWILFQSINDTFHLLSWRK